MTEEDVATLYRCLLGRAPETADTVAAFRDYYGEFSRGRAAILQSAEFSSLFAGIAGNAPETLAQAFLRRAGGAAADAHAENTEIAGAMRLMLRAHGGVHLAVVVGDGGMRLADLLPFDSARPAVLHVAPEFPAFVPQCGVLPSGAALFRVRFDAALLHDFLRDAELHIDAMIVMEAAAPWLEALRPVLAPRAILLGHADIVAATRDWSGIERPVTIGALTACCRHGWFLPVRYTPAADIQALPRDAPKLWLAAIVCNEQESILNMLQSVAPVAAGFVLIDTGSTDDTVARAQDFLQSTGKPFILHRQAFERFDTMRNAALDLVPQDADWVLMLDADEELCPEDHAKLLEVLCHATHDAYALPRYNYAGIDKGGEVLPYPDRQVRLLRHHCVPKIRYSGAVHEKVRGVDIGLLKLDASVLGQGSGGPHIHHLVRRFRSPQAEAEKQARYKAIAEEYG